MEENGNINAIGVVDDDDGRYNDEDWWILITLDLKSSSGPRGSAGHGQNQMDAEGIICSIQDAKTHMVGLYFHWTSSSTSGKETRCAAVIVTEVKWFLSYQCV